MTDADIAAHNQAVQEVAATADVPITDVPPRPNLSSPSSGLVRLPGGYLKFGLEEPVKVAEVRELNGYDEEKLSRVQGGATGKFLTKILELGTVKIGDDEVNSKILDDLLTGDRDAILLGIRIATYGRELEMEIACPHCDEEQKVTLDLPTEVPVKELDEDDRSFDVELRNGTIARVNMPTGKSQREVLNAVNKTTAELNTILITSCVESIDNLPVGLNAIRGLGIPDRERISRAISEHSCGPQFGEVGLPCKECGERIALPLTLADLFRL